MHTFLPKLQTNGEIKETSNGNQMTKLLLINLTEEQAFVILHSKSNHDPITLSYAGLALILAKDVEFGVSNKSRFCPI